MFDLEPVARIVLQIAGLFFGFVIGNKMFNCLGGVIGALLLCWLLPKVLLITWNIKQW